MLPLTSTDQQRHGRRRGQRRVFRALTAAVLLAVGPLAYYTGALTLNFDGQRPVETLPINAQGIINKCQALNRLPGPPPDFHDRAKSDRYEPGTKPVLVKNAKIWTGRDEGYEVVQGDLLLANGIIKAVGHVSEALRKRYKDATVIDAQGSWLTPGYVLRLCIHEVSLTRFSIIDVHSHLGVDSAPELEGSDDTNSLKGLAMPWLRSLDGLNTHDEAYRLSISGGVTTANVLPGSADAIGGQAFTIKLRETSEKTTTSLLLEPPFGINGTETLERPRWRQMK